MRILHKSLIEELKEIGIKITKALPEDIVKSDNLIFPTKDRNGMIKIKLKNNE